MTASRATKESGNSGSRRFAFFLRTASESGLAKSVTEQRIPVPRCAESPIEWAWHSLPSLESCCRSSAAMSIGTPSAGSQSGILPARSHCERLW